MDLSWVTVESLAGVVSGRTRSRSGRSVVAMKARKSPTLLVVSAFALVFGSLVLAPAASADGCVGSVPIGNTTSCPGDGSSSGNFTAAPITGNGNPFGSVDGINCTQANYHTCRALQETGNAAP